MASVFSDGTVVIDGMKMRSTRARSRSRMWPCTSFAGKQIVSDATAGRPSSNMRRVDACDSLTSKPSERQNVVQNGIVSQNASTRGIPMVMPRGFASSGAG